MYSSAGDESTGTLVGIYSGRESSEADYLRALEGFREMDRAADVRRVPLIYVTVVDRQSFRPSPLWRRRFAEANKHLRSAQAYFVVVTASPFIRHLYKTVAWLSCARIGYYSTACATLSEARRWIERNVGASYPILSQLEQRALGAFSPEGGCEPSARPRTLTLTQSPA